MGKSCMNELPEENAQQVRRWVEKAEHDLLNARHTLSLGDRTPFDTVCFHANSAQKNT